MAFDNVGGADFLIFEALRAGHKTVPAIAAYCCIEQLAAREALNRLRTKGRLRRYGDKRGAWYRIVKKRVD